MKKFSPFLIVNIFIACSFLFICATCEEEDPIEDPHDDPGNSIQYCNKAEIVYKGVAYTAVQIGTQCWMAQNLNVGTMIHEKDDMTDNGIVEKYCFDNKEENCVKYGALYTFAELMQYDYQEGAQGICPPGWHIPTDEEWLLMEGTIDSQYGVDWSRWITHGYRGYDCGKKLMSTSWNGSDDYGFNWIRAPWWHQGNFNGGYSESFLWTSSKATYRRITWDHQNIDRYAASYNYDGLGVRCIRD